MQTAERIQLYTNRGRGRGRGRGGFPGRSLPQPPANGPESEIDAGKGLSTALQERLGGKEGGDKPAYQNRRRDEHDHRYSRQEWNERMFARRHRDDFEGDQLPGSEEQVPSDPQRQDSHQSDVKRSAACRWVIAARACFLSISQ